MLSRALHHCQTLLRQKQKLGSSRHHQQKKFPKDAVALARRSKKIRKTALSAFENTPIIRESIDVLRQNFTVEDFTRRYEIPLRPCLLQEQVAYFDTAARLWADQADSEKWFRLLSNQNTERTDNQKEGRVTVPVMVSSEDEDSPACREEWPLDDWIDLLRGKKPIDRGRALSDYYLKDWHLQAYLQNNNSEPLYNLPNCFGYDLINEFWKKFNKNALEDYRFVYWGPRGSQTGWHGDILYTFSWSYNVRGVKEWEFEVPGTDRRIHLQQKTGELLFVPSLWQHSVYNVEETISINHNWMTASNVDLVWKSLNAGRRHIDAQEEDIGNNDRKTIARKEDTLSDASGGLNVAVFFFMVLARGVELSCQSNPDWVACHDMVRLRDMLIVLLNDEQLKQRLGVALDDSGDAEANAAIQMATEYVGSVDQRIDDA